MWRKLVVLIVLGITLCIAQESEPACKTNKSCDCCKSKSDGGDRAWSDICENKEGDWKCTHGCKDGYWGRKCWHYCPASCISCHREYRYNKICFSCVNGNYGTICGTHCPTNCAQNKCDKTTGKCLQGCINNRSGDKCNFCADTWYGNNCDIRCPDVCIDRICNSNGECTTGCADDNFTGTLCNQCNAGKYGDFCDDSCPVNCKGDKCNRIGGNCSNGCNDNFKGDRCMSCDVGFFGNMCEDECPKNCLNGECSRENGQCLSCKVGNYGQTCNKTCLDRCGGNVCRQNDGTCLNCTVGYHGNVCDIPCKEDCINDTCLQYSGDCTHGCINGCKEESSQSSPLSGAIGGSVGGLVVIALVVFGVLFFLRRKRLQQQTNKKYITDEPMSDINAAVVDNGVYENCNAVALNSESKPPTADVVSKQKQDGHNAAMEGPDEPDTEDGEVDDDYYTFRNVINVEDLQTYVREKAGNYLTTEFRRLARGLKQPCIFATRRENIALNRFNGIYPYDHSRVKLDHDKKFFINACYIHGNQKLKAYIASLGPTKVTTDNFATFWKMVWFEKSDIIVMLTNLQEPSGMKCQQYWPDRKQSLIFRNLEIKCDSIEDFAEYTVRTFTICKEKERRTVSQLHFTAWPDKSVPNNVTSLVEFRQRVKSTYTLSQGPVIVHCSAGIGRTGTYIAIDLLTEIGLSEGNVDVFGCIRTMREQRVNMVQTPDQYEYVHRAIVYTLTFDVDYTPTETFNDYVMSLTDSQYAAMFKNLSTPIEAVDQEHKQAVSLNQQYKDKNRSKSDVPGNNGRPMLYLNRSFNDLNYINAVYVNGFKRKNKFILAQTPLPATLNDFVCLIYQEKCSCIVSVEMTDSQDVGCYIPELKESLTFGSFVITCMKYQNKYNHQYRQLKITNKGKQSTGERIINHYQYTNWKTNEKVPSSDADFVQFIKDTQASVHDDGKSPMLLHCLTGGKKCGLFCTVSLLLERADIIRQISVVNTVRMLRLRRPNVIPNKEQLKFAHQCVASQMEVLSTYTNFSM